MKKTSHDLVVLFISKVTHRDDRGARLARREKQAYQVYANTERHSAARDASVIECHRIYE
jgi:hypothetical protein